MKHGGDLTEAMARFGGAPGDWLDLSTGINPHAWPLRDIARRSWESLPAKRDMEALLLAACAAYAVPRNASIVAAPGTQALIQWMPQLAPEGRVAVLSPTYNEHAAALRAAGRSVVEIFDTADLADATSLIVVNPNNPDGRVLTAAQLASMAADIKARGGWLVVDESFVDTMPDASGVGLCETHPVVVLRSFGKFYGLAGVRLGFLIANAEIAARFRGALGPWAVAGPALAIGRAALSDMGWAAQMRRQLGAEAAVLDALLVGNGFSVAGGTSLYRLARHSAATALHEHLASQRIWVRRFDWDDQLLRFGLPASSAGLVRLQQALAAHATA